MNTNIGGWQQPKTVAASERRRLFGAIRTLRRQVAAGLHTAPRPAEVQRLLAAAGISQRQAAPRLGVRFEHLNRVLNGHRQSKRLLAAAGQLATRQGGGR